MILSPKVKFTTTSKQVIVRDSIFKSDTIRSAKKEVVEIKKTFLNLKNKEISKTDFIWPQSFLNDLLGMKSLADGMLKDGHEVSVVIGGISKEAADDLAGETGIKATYLTADDILLKTIMRSNPGVVLWKEGKIVNKWHKLHLPEYGTLKTSLLK